MNGVDAARSADDSPQSSEGAAKGDGLRATPRLGVRRLLGILGPGLVTGASDDDPSGIATYAQAGAEYGYRTLWTVFLCLPLMIAVQEICDRTALATGNNLGELVRTKYAGAARIVVLVLLCILLVANGINVAADLMAVGQGFALLGWGGAPIWSALAGVGIMALVGLGTFGVVSRAFRVLCLSLLAYPVVLIAVHVDWAHVLKGSLALAGDGSKGFWILIVGILGTTISPYLFFWQSADRVEDIDEREDEGEAAELDDEPTAKGARRRLTQSRLDVVAGMLFSEIVAFAIIAATAATLGAKSTKVSTAADAARALQPIAGHWATLLFALGFIGSGTLAVPVLAGSASTAVAGITGQRWGYRSSLRRAPFFYVLVGLGTLGGTLLSVIYSDPIGLLVFSAVVNGIAAAPFLVVVMFIAQDRNLMGRYRLGVFSRTLGWITVALMATAGVVGVLTL